MDGSSKQQPFALEDQIRNMIPTGASPPPPSQQLHQQPTARLPPGGPYHGVQPAPLSNPNWRAQNGPPPQHRQTPTRYGGINAGPPPAAVQQPVYGRQNQGAPRQRAYQQHQPVDPHAFLRGPTSLPQLSQQRRQLYQPSAQGPPIGGQPHWQMMQAEYLESIAAREVPLLEMSQNERDEKDAFRKELEAICQAVCRANPDRLPMVSIECFGSLQSGFASAGSDMDLVTVVQDSSPTAACFSLLEDDLPRALERRLLQAGYGAHLLTRTRVPIIKVCQKPGSNLLSRLRQEREKWDDLPNELKYPHLKKDQDEHAEDDLGKIVSEAGSTLDQTARAVASGDTIRSDDVLATTAPLESVVSGQSAEPTDEAKAPVNTIKGGDQTPKQKREPWTRERKAGPLDFPKTGTGIQCDITFFNPLGIHNTQLLRCYSLCDPRVRPMVLFVKAWAKQRKINSSYSGTLSSYGYVLMVLHYLTNIARPAVLPNLQHPWRPNAQCTPQSADRVEVDGCIVDFWRREDEIISAVQNGQMTLNRDPLGSLLAGFFQYYSSQGGYPSFHWMGEVLSLRTLGGLLSKEEKGWVKAVTEQGEGKQVQHRYLFAIEDPFENTHNVARTVTHNGIVAIRDEFRRANRILRAISSGQVPRDGQLFDPLIESPSEEQTGNVIIPGDAARVSQPLAPAGQQRQRQQRFGQFPMPVQAKLINVRDGDAFPALAPTKSAQAPKPAKAPGQKKRQSKGSGGEISGDRAKAYLEELKRKKAEEAAGLTASGMAESVLGP